nr:MAG TPA: hypothetical protein [Caudoviricetes sp.]
MLYLCILIHSQRKDSPVYTRLSSLGFIRLLGN